MEMVWRRRPSCGRRCGLHVVILTASESDDHLYHAVRLGASGYLLKSLDAAELFDLLAGVARGKLP